MKDKTEYEGTDGFIQARRDGVVYDIDLQEGGVVLRPHIYVPPMPGLRYQRPLWCCVCGGETYHHDVVGHDMKAISDQQVFLWVEYKHEAAMYAKKITELLAEKERRERDVLAKADRLKNRVNVRKVM